ncbi:hypothetical protein GCM10023346_00350 [Arthrobacter gyeryongensis]|uniref:Uncharacterized protein n=1 Tax=Arthrobacter gyeryongensis TaxID=1650592 RepID=A0ABP9RYQ1_9MICC
MERTNAALARLGANPADSDCKDVSSAACEADFTNANNDLWPVNQIVKEWAPYMK